MSPLQLLSSSFTPTQHFWHVDLNAASPSPRLNMQVERISLRVELQFPARRAGSEDTIPVGSRKIIIEGMQRTWENRRSIEHRPPRKLKQELSVLDLYGVETRRGKELRIFAVNNAQFYQFRDPAIHISSSRVLAINPGRFVYENAHGKASTFPEPFVGMEGRERSGRSIVNLARVMADAEGVQYRRTGDGDAYVFPDVRFGEGCRTADVPQASSPRASGLGNITRKPVGSRIECLSQARPGSSLAPNLDHAPQPRASGINNVTRKPIGIGGDQEIAFVPREKKIGGGAG
ncbi:hypothetical protein EV421DRAFT_2028418, partial [Armillaria borealis]